MLIRQGKVLLKRLTYVRNQPPLWEPSLLLQYKTKIKIHRQTSKICSSKKLMRYLEQNPYRVYCSKLTIFIRTSKHTLRKKKENVDENQDDNLESPSSSSRVSLNQSDKVSINAVKSVPAPPPPRPHWGRGGFVYHNLADLLLSSLSSLFPWRRLRTKLGRAAWNMA